MFIGFLGVFAVQHGAPVHFTGFLVINGFHNDGNNGLLPLLVLCFNGFGFINGLLFIQGNITDHKTVFDGKGIEPVKHEIHRSSRNVLHTHHTQVLFTEFREAAAEEHGIFNSVGNKVPNVRTNDKVVIGNTVMKIGQSLFFTARMNLHEVICKTFNERFALFQKLCFHFGKVIICHVLILHNFIQTGRQRIENSAELLHRPFHFLQNLLIGLIQNAAGPLHDFRRPFITDGQIKFIVINLMGGDILFSFLFKFFQDIIIKMTMHHIISTPFMHFNENIVIPLQAHKDVVQAHIVAVYAIFRHIRTVSAPENISLLKGAVVIENNLIIRHFSPCHNILKAWKSFLSTHNVPPSINNNGTSV